MEFIIVLLFVIVVVLFYVNKTQKIKLLKISEENDKLVKQIKDSGFDVYEKGQSKLQELKTNLEIYIAQNKELEKENNSLSAKIKTDTNKLTKIREKILAINYACEEYKFAVPSVFKIKEDIDEINSLCPTVTLNPHSLDMKDLQKAYRENDKHISELTELYQSRYTTKANQAIYSLMVIALRAELQNILYDLKYQKLDQGIDNVKAVTAKYLSISCDGNQSIAPTMTKFIGELEYHFLNAVKIEYEYYIKKEQARQEQIEIRERMKQEAAERKALDMEKKKIEAEEIKYQNQIHSIKEKMEDAANDELEALKKRLLELEGQLSNVVIKKEEIVNLQNGKAGNVYIISNLGSFGENVFKIGMTRRLDPQDRIDELGSASVPFEFDVHSFIFSEDAVGLENELHKRLDKQRVNKVNGRKEFFRSSIEELEALTHEISPTAEFNKTMAAEEYRQSLSVDETA